MANSASLTLVAIDDDPESLKLIEYALNQPDLNIATATDPEAGWNLVLTHRPQIVLLDLILPGVSGMELLSRIIELDPGIDVILLTSHDSIESAVKAI